MPREPHEVSELFVTHLLSRNIRYEEDLVDQTCAAGSPHPGLLEFLKPSLLFLDGGCRETCGASTRIQVDAR